MKVLAYTSPARGHLYPVVPILSELAARGHRPSVLALSGELEQLAPLGIEGMPIDGALERIEIEDWRERLLPKAGISALRTFVERASHEAPDLARAIARLDPDVLLIDVNCWGAATVAEASGRPWAIYSPYLLPLPSRDAPPFGLGLAPMEGVIGRARDALLGGVLRTAFDRTAMPGINALRVAGGLGRLDSYSDVLARPPLLLALTAEGFEYPRGDWPANVRLVGAINWDPSHSPHSSSRLPTPAWVADVRDPVVLVTCSTERQRDKRLLHVALEALPPAGISVIGTSAAHDPDQFHAPAGSRVVRFLPHDRILERAVCVVCHGGMGITQKALAAEVPVVVVPGGRDQLDTARRVEVAAAGTRLSPRRLTPERLLDAVRAAIERRAGARRVSRALAEAGGSAAAADALEALGRGRQSGRGAGEPPRGASRSGPVQTLARGGADT